MRFIHITDPHLSSLAGSNFWRLRGKRRLGYLSWTRNRRHFHKCSVLETMFDAVVGRQPDYIAITGDLVQIGLPQELAEARQWLDRMAGIAPLLLVPGNHDVYQSDSIKGIKTAWRDYLPDDMSGDGFPHVVTQGKMKFILVNSSSPQPFWSAGGTVDGEQMRRLENILSAGDDAFRCVLVHHPPLPGLCAPRKAMSNASEFADLLKRYDVELTLYGHVHRNQENVVARHSRILSTASASNTGPPAPAAFRCFDIGFEPAMTRVYSRLMSLDLKSGQFRTADEQTWDYAPAS